MNYRLATSDDLELLVEMRLEFINVQVENDKYEDLRKNCYKHLFDKAFKANACEVVLAEDGDKCIGTGIVYYYDLIPSLYSPNGKKGYVTSMYVAPDYRRRGIGAEILEQLIERAKIRGVKEMFLNPSEMGRPLYEKRGFKDNHRDGMTLDLKNEK